MGDDRCRSAGASGVFRTIALLAGSVALLTLAFAPVDQFYLAWVGLVPWLVFLAESRSKKSAFFLSWVAGTAFLYRQYVVDGLPLVGRAWRRCDVLRVVLGVDGPGHSRGGIVTAGGISSGVLGIAMVWTAFEWLRGVIFTGLPWLFLGYSQTPISGMCQIADIAGVYGVSFWVVTLNALVAMAWLNRGRPKWLIPAAAAVVGNADRHLAVWGCYRIGQNAAVAVAGADGRGGSGKLSSEQFAAKRARRFHIGWISRPANPFGASTGIAGENRPGGLVRNDDGGAQRHEPGWKDPTYRGFSYELEPPLRNNHVALVTGGEYYSRLAMKFARRSRIGGARQTEYGLFFRPRRPRGRFAWASVR